MRVNLPYSVHELFVCAAQTREMNVRQKKTRCATSCGPTDPAVYPGSHFFERSMGRNHQHLHIVLQKHKSYVCGTELCHNHQTFICPACISSKRKIVTLRHFQSSTELVHRALKYRLCGKDKI
jgi:hypothetical protein